MRVMRPRRGVFFDARGNKSRRVYSNVFCFRSAFASVPGFTRVDSLSFLLAAPLILINIYVAINTYDASHQRGLAIGIRGKQACCNFRDQLGLYCPIVLFHEFGR